MPTWIIEPRDPLIARDGRPFGPQPGARAATLRFPFPSTTTGGVRTRAGLNGHGVFDESAANIDRVKRIGVRGPLLVELDAGGAITRWLAAAPADALLLEGTDDEHAARLRLAPLEPFAGAGTNLPEGLSLVGLPTPDPRKPLGAAPRYWYWPVFEQWLIAPGRDEPALADLGHGGPPSEQRMHVRIARDTLTSVDGALFQTSGLEFTHKASDAGLGAARRLAMAVSSTPDRLDGLAPLAGERRLMAWRKGSEDFPLCPPALRAAIVADKHCRVVLLTPAHFARGYHPTWLLRQRDGVTAELKAVAAQRPQVVSGWDFAASSPEGRGAPKPTRRLLPAGSVLFLRLQGDAAQIGKWVDNLWMTCISDEEQDRHDGFGLAVLGTWDGQAWPMKDRER